MYELRKLLDRFWVTREGDPAIYFALKRAQPEYRRFVSEALGWSLIINESVVKLEKASPRAMPWMGIAAFNAPLDYCLFCAVLLWLADLDDGEQFLLSALTESVEAYLAEIRPVDWTRFTDRKALVRVLRYAEQVELLRAYDGDKEGFAGNRLQEVLYETTGLSRSFPMHFGRDILHCRTVEDFEALAREGEPADRGWQRRKRVYQHLALCPALYWSEEDRSDYDYVKNQHHGISANMENYLGGELHLHKNGAFLVFGEGESCGMAFPGSRVMSDAVLLLCTQLREMVREGVYPRGSDDRVTLSRPQFRQELLRCRDRYAAGLGQELRKLSPDRFCEAITTYMADWMLLEDRGETIRLCPAVGKWCGEFPAAWIAKQGGQNEPLANE